MNQCTTIQDNENAIIEINIKITPHGDINEITSDELLEQCKSTIKGIGYNLEEDGDLE